MSFEKNIKELSQRGLTICSNESLESWEEFRDVIHGETHDFLEEASYKDPNPNKLNAIRLNAFRQVNVVPDWERKYFSMAGNLLKELLGPDLLIQRKLNLSIQMPNDSSSLLGMHADTLSGQSPFEIVMWTSFTKVHDTNGMFYFDRPTSSTIFQDLAKFEREGLDYLREKYWSKVHFLELDPGQVVLFSGTLFHGNILNETSSTRISINCRFKNLYSPSGSGNSVDRGVGIFYKLFSESIVTKIARDYLNTEPNFDI